MANLRKRKIKGKSYYYLEEIVRIGEDKWKNISIYLGKNKPSSKSLANKRKELSKKVNSAILDFYNQRLSQFTFSFLSQRELAEAERLKDNFWTRFNRLSSNQKNEFNRKQLVDFVYTTLRTEGVDVEFSDIETAFQIVKNKKKKPILNEKVIISSSMITGFNFLPKIGMNEKDILRLHGIVMSYFENETPGQLRDDQRIIARYNPLSLQSEEIKYRPPAPEKIDGLFKEFFEWYENNKTIHPLELAALVHLKIYLIHPFKDGNKRMCRLLFNKILQDSHYPMMNISKNTSKYFESLIKSVETGKEKFFIKFCYETFIKQIKYKRL